MELRNVDWKIEPGPDGSLPPEHITNALLMDIRETARSIKKILLFFAGLTILYLLVAFLVALAFH
jgi:hypothetical protein